MSRAPSVVAEEWVQQRFSEAEPVADFYYPL